MPWQRVDIIRRGEGAEGGGGWGLAGLTTASPNPLEETTFLIVGPSQRRRGSGVLQAGVTGEGIKRWGIEGIRIVTSDRFGRGRGELLRIPLLAP